MGEFLLFFVMFICFIVIYYTKIRDFKRKKLNTNPKKAKEITTKKVTRKEATGLTFGLSPKAIHLNKNKVLVTESAAQEEGHSLAVGGSGIGKTSAFVIPTLRNWAKSIGTFLCWDISGDIHPRIINDDTLPGRAIIFEVGNVNATAYNAFGAVDRAKTRERKIKRLIQLAHIIMQKPKETSEAGDYYRRQALKMLKAALIAFYFQGMDFIEICEKNYYLDWHQLLNAIDATGDKDAIRYINGFADPDLPRQFTSSAKQVLEDAVELFATDENIKKVLHRNIERDGKVIKSWDPYFLEKYSVFVVVDDADLEEYEQLNCLIANQVLHYIKKRSLDKSNPILICMDEAASLGNIDILPALRKFRKRHCRILMLTQSIVDLDLTWGEKERKAMMTNFRFKVVLECSEPDEQEYWSKLAGKEWIWVKNSRIQHPDGTITYNEEQVERNVIEPWQLANMGDQLLLITPEGSQVLDKNYYFKQ